MRIISDSIVARQVQPVDFSFLSNADTDIVIGVEKMLRTMCGFSNERVPIILSGVLVDMTSKPSLSGNEESTYRITEGRILSGGHIVDFEAIDVVKPTYSYDSLLESVRWMKRQSLVSPSPVRNANGDLNVQCHWNMDSWTHQSKTTKPSSKAEGGIWVLSDMYRLQTMATLDSVYGLQERIEKLESKIG
ncbi:MAG: hypothetical protein IJ180_09635 [Bacteroidales bacterium]|nr:hypothetical protein [Bacteroidales bacterium]